MPEISSRLVRGVGHTNHRDPPISSPQTEQTNTLAHSRKTPAGRGKLDSRDIFERLQSRGIGADEFGKILRIIAFDLPQSTLFFEQQFRNSRPQQVLRQTEKWRHLLAMDFILSEDQRKDIEKSISLAETLAWNALRDASFPRLGPWHLSCVCLPTSFQDGKPSYIYPDIELVAIHEATKEKRIAVIRGAKAAGASSTDAWRSGFETLGLLDLVLKQRPRRRFVSREQHRVWPVYTQFVIPRLYEFMLPYYRSRGHVWSEKGGEQTHLAYYPKELLEDMLEILQQQHPHAFGSKIALQIKSMIQRHRERKSTSTTKSS
jgi:hypothetical protein